MKEGGGKGEAGSGRREAGGGREKSADLVEPTPFAQRMKELGMAAPPALVDSIRRAGGLGDATDDENPANENSTVEDTLRAVEQLLDRILGGECESREYALDLLTVDALVTRAMEIAARDPDSLAKFAESAMKRISTR